MNEIVTIQHREAVTTSLIIADVFCKRHKDVIRGIENIISEITSAILRPLNTWIQKAKSALCTN